jgi:hypothetical protein
MLFFWGLNIHTDTVNFLSYRGQFRRIKGLQLFKRTKDSEFFGGLTPGITTLIAENSTAKVV